MNKINHSQFRVAIFGSARSKKGEKSYKLTYDLAKLIAENNFDLVTGGGPGLMDAASRGHHAGRRGGDVRSIGLTILLPKEQHDGFHLDIKEEFNKFSARLDKFMQLSNVVVVAPGGVGTMLEFFYTWQLLQVKHICDNVPIIMLGSMWEGLMDWVKKQPLKRRLLSKDDLNNIFMVNTPQQAMELIKKAEESHRLGKNVCLNIS
jgi:uncharacterized protein (TIGR00730 family)